MTNHETFVPGLEGIIASETTISLLDTEKEQINIRGNDLIDLSKQQTYVDIVYLLLEGILPQGKERQALEKQLRQHEAVPETIMAILKLLPKTTHPMDAQRTGISALSGFDDAIDDRSESMNKQRAYRLLAQLPTLTVNGYRILTGQPLCMPDDSLSYSANFLYMITGEKPSELEVSIFDRSLLLYSEHEMPNSTFSARVIASTLSDMYGALSGAVASLKGSLHGGANEAVMYMLNAAGSVDEFVKLLRQKLKNKEKVMGFGHRVYMKKIDPRARMMKESLKQLCDLHGDSRLLAMCEAGETVMAEEKGLFPNLDYYAAPVYWMLGIPIPLYTPIFFCSRTAGLCAHITEQHAHNRLFRPRVHYTGKQID